jgi:four helix bundle protein
MNFHTYTSFEKLEVWQLARMYKKEIYILSRKFPSEEKFGYISQLRRSASSISTNLAEGSGRSSNQDKAHFTNIAFTSALEVIDHLVGAYDLEFITESEYIAFRQKLDVIIKKLNRLYQYQINDTTTLKSRLKDNS